jgi:hypothetical protein
MFGFDLPYYNQFEAIIIFINYDLSISAAPHAGTGVEQAG